MRVASFSDGPWCRWIACGVVALVLCASGCSGGDEVPLSEGPERYARQYVPRVEKWIPESEIPSDAQATPRMVIWEVSDYAGAAEPSERQQQWIAEFRRECEQTARDKGWFDFQQGLRDDFRLLVNDRRHYYNEEFIFDDAVLDCERPEFLMYYGTPLGKQLVGMMFYVAEPMARGPQRGGAETVWHFHVWNRPTCMLRGLLGVGDPAEGEPCERGVSTHRSPEMLHLWFLEHPDGPFATGMFIEPELVRETMRKRGLRVPG